MSASFTISSAVATRDWSWAGRRVVVMGLGSFGGNLAVIRWLVGLGAEVTVTDRASADSLADSCRAIADLPVRLHLGGHRESDLSGADLLVVSPAVDKRSSPFVHQARELGIPWTSEMNLFIERCQGRIVGVTGSAGKSTVCAMIHAICVAALDRSEPSFRTCLLGGNIGTSLLEKCATLSADDLVVLELSSFQLEDLAVEDWYPEIAVLTGLSPNHLARHGSMQRYVDAKLDLLRAQAGRNAAQPDGRQPAVVCMADEPDIVSRVRRIVGGTGAKLHLTTLPQRERKLLVPGKHNQRNAEGAAAVAGLLGVPADIADAALSEFEGLPHRLEWVTRIRGVDYLNDSKATSPVATTTALLAIDKPVVAIVGGQAKPGLDVQNLVDTLLARARAVVCTGSCGPEWATILRQGCDKQPNLAFSRRSIQTAADLAEAVKLASQTAGDGDTVLFSPAAPSYDQFANYEVRGDAFVRCVESLRG
ncbi:MAG: UDP-N-acetylmuramoyl-L-alanine--D-glutamate ligase [Planctomycetes bacterium]|nr:UDP-N-acetylmuramoyl-L-alanine--D-glutamate ligase [Planctomycetota bacterium]